MARKDHLGASNMTPLAAVLEQLAEGEGYHPTILNGVGIFRSERSNQREPLCYRQGLIIMAQGTKRVYLEDQVYEYNPDNYLVLTLPVPADCEAITEPGRPLLSLVIDIDLTMLHEIVRVFDDCGRNPVAGTREPERSLFVSPAGADFRSCTLRLARALQDPVKAKVLGPGLVREILLHTLQGPGGSSLMALARHNTSLSRLEPVMKYIHTHFANALDVEQLAAMANMSSPTFHRNFRKVTSLSPIQYIKRIRLTRARDLLLDQQVQVGQAASEVGYESPSQFSREFKRFFGQPPKSMAGGASVPPGNHHAPAL
ncbi:AraC family transcriptional regulator [Marinobacter sp. CA1]|uniref:AraC family transcriptional regulator n=1 Tax=Marinobacter sp. CA1 TaxID=2817656 RepID=UPI001D07AA72|nr:AraC family transcriptional regulator [Marinobacter sp. CA1]MCG8517770.1 AraC family transcriptional regulator [Pseudomonadales bacterium]